VKNYKVRLSFRNGVTGTRYRPKDVDLFSILDEIKLDQDMNNHDWLDNEQFYPDKQFVISRLEFDKTTGNLKSLELTSTGEHINDPF
jgi:hypothetical protein